MKDKEFSTIKKIAIIITLIAILNFFQGLVQNIIARKWDTLLEKSFTFLIYGAMIFWFWRYYLGGWSGLKKQKEASKERFERNKENIGIKDAIIFSLAWSKEIYEGIPGDRKKLVKVSFILIGMAGVIVFMHLGKYGLMSLLSIAGLTLAGVNLLIWVVGSERQEKERLSIELEAARKMQLGLMPSEAPSLSGFDIAGCCIPAHDVGGDLFDFVWFGKNREKLCIPVVDVSGKGMDAAFTAVYTSGALISEAQHEHDVVTVMDNLNSAIYSRQNRSRFVSLLMVALNIPSREIAFVNAGQSKPIFFRKNNVEILKGCGSRFPLGIRQTPDYKQEKLQLEQGDILLLYTDGVTEAMDENQEMFGENRLKDIFITMASREMTASGMVNEIKNEVIRFTGPGNPQDDLTIVIIKVI